MIGPLREVLDFAHGVECVLLRHRDRIAAETAALLQFDIDPDDTLLNVNRTLPLLRNAGADALTSMYHATPEAIQKYFVDEGGADREDAEDICRVILEKLAAVPALSGRFQ